MRPNKFRFKKWVRRNNFTRIFGNMGKRRSIKDFFIMPKRIKAVFKMQSVRRAHQGYMNKIFGRVNAIKIRREFGRYPKVPDFRR